MNIFKLRGVLLLLLLGITSACAILSNQPPPFADIHLHYNYTHDELMEPQDAIKILTRHNVVLSTVSSEPTDFALKLSDAGKGWIIPFASPYYKAGNRMNWYFDKKLVGEIRKRLESGKFQGIGEVHITPGVGPHRENPVFVGLLELADEFNLPFLIHTDSDNYRYFLGICEKFPRVRFIWAHASGTLMPDSLRPLMQQCQNVWLDLAGRDPDHYGALADDNGKLVEDWHEFIIEYQDRIMTGTDPVWNAFQIYRWYESDHGWEHYDDFLNFHRRWLKKLPASVEEKIRLTNAQQFFGIKGR